MRTERPKLGPIEFIRKVEQRVIARGSDNFSVADLSAMADELEREGHRVGAEWARKIAANAGPGVLFRGLKPADFDRAANALKAEIAEDDPAYPSFHEPKVPEVAASLRPMVRALFSFRLDREEMRTEDYAPALAWFESPPTALPQRGAAEISIALEALCAIAGVSTAEQLTPAVMSKVRERLAAHASEREPIPDPLRTTMPLGRFARMVAAGLIQRPEASEAGRFRELGSKDMALELFDGLRKVDSTDTPAGIPLPGRISETLGREAAELSSVFGLLGTRPRWQQSQVLTRTGASGAGEAVAYAEHIGASLKGESARCSVMVDEGGRFLGAAWTSKLLSGLVPERNNISNAQVDASWKPTRSLPGPRLLANATATEAALAAMLLIAHEKYERSPRALVGTREDAVWSFGQTDPGEKIVRLDTGATTVTAVFEVTRSGGQDRAVLRGWTSLDEENRRP
jgi:hypothetical protein